MSETGESVNLHSDSITSWLPSFSKASDKELRRILVRRSGLAAGWIAFITLCIVLPLWNYLSLKRWFFKLRHHLRHDIFRKYRWLHGSPLYHSQTLKICTFWSALSIACTFVAASGDLLQITKRLGKVAVALMPPLLFLTLRPSPLPYTLYLSLIPIHKWISRIVVSLSFLHSVLYTWYFIESRAIKKITKLANLYGVAAMALFILIAVTSVSGMRRYNFRVFYYVHYISTWLTVVLIHFHARPPIPYYTAMNCIILIVQIGYRVFHTAKVRVTVVPVSDSMILVEFPLSCLRKKPVMPSGSIRMAPFYKYSPLKRIFQQIAPLQHPYTIASLPTDTNVKLIIRPGRFKPRNNSEYLVTGAFEPKIDFITKNLTKVPISFQNQTPALLASPLHYNIDARRALIVAGGSAISFGLPLLRILNFNGVTVRLKWVTRDYRDLKILNHFRNNFDGLEIYITGSIGEEQDLQIDYVDFDEDPDVMADQGSTPARHDTVSSFPGSNYGTFKSTDFPSGRTFQSQGRSNQEDEIDFTQMYSARGLKSKKSFLLQKSMSSLDEHGIFRKPSIVVPPPEQAESTHSLPTSYGSEPKSLKIPAGVQVFFERPNLTNHDYQWCLERECIGPSDTNDCFRLNGPAAHVDDLSRVWVIATGPPQLVENTKRWATDGGLHFHEESFTL